MEALTVPVVLYTMAEVAGMLRVTERTVKARVKDGTLKSHKVGRLRRITQQQYDSYLESTCST